MTQTAPSSAHFSDAELRCPCCGRNAMQPEALEMVEEFRTLGGNLPVSVHSAYRCPDRNLADGGAPRSQHLLGRALDVSIAGKTPAELEAIARSCTRVAGIGRHKGFIHIDCRLGPAAEWCYGDDGEQCAYFPPTKAEGGP